MPRKFIAEGASLVERDGKYLLVSIDGSWDFPSAVMDEEEDRPIDCARHETLEETGARVEPEEIVGVYITPISNRAFDLLSFVYECEIASGDPGTRKGAGIEVDWFTLDEVADLSIEAPYIIKAIQDYERGNTGPPDLVQAWRRMEETQYGE
jgi:8-oxo-dGTP pyrophosphatase MutT (NUDIX family)